MAEPHNPDPGSGEPSGKRWRLTLRQWANNPNTLRQLRTAPDEQPSDGPAPLTYSDSLGVAGPLDYPGAVNYPNPSNAAGPTDHADQTDNADSGLRSPRSPFESTGSIDPATSAGSAPSAGPMWPGGTGWPTGPARFDGPDQPLVAAGAARRSGGYPQPTGSTESTEPALRSVAAPTRTGPSGRPPADRDDEFETLTIPIVSRLERDDAPPSPAIPIAARTTERQFDDQDTMVIPIVRPFVESVPVEGTQADSTTSDGAASDSAASDSAASDSAASDSAASDSAASDSAASDSAASDSAASDSAAYDSAEPSHAENIPAENIAGSDDADRTIAIPIVRSTRPAREFQPEPLDEDPTTPAFGITLPGHLPPPPFSGTPAWPTVHQPPEPLPRAQRLVPQPLPTSLPPEPPPISHWRPTDAVPRSYPATAPYSSNPPVTPNATPTAAPPELVAGPAADAPTTPDHESSHERTDVFAAVTSTSAPSTSAPSAELTAEPRVAGRPGAEDATFPPARDTEATAEPTPAELESTEPEPTQPEPTEPEPDKAETSGPEPTEQITENAGRQAAPVGQAGPEASNAPAEPPRRPSARASAFKNAPTFFDVVLAYVPPYPEPVVPVRPPVTPQPTPAPAPTPARPALPPPPEAEWQQRRQVSADEITHENIVEPDEEVPRRGWRARVFSATGGRVNPGVGSDERTYLDVLDRVRRPVRGARQIAVSSIKGGVGKTTVSACLGLMLAEHRGDGVIAVDADPDAGNLADRLTGKPDVTVRHLLADLDAIRALSDFGLYTSLARRLRVLAGDQDPATGDSFRRDEYERVCDTLTRFFNIVITDSGTGLVHDAMRGILTRADRLIVVGSPTVDGASRASKTLDWLLAHGHERLADDAVVVLSGDRSSAKINYVQLRSHFRRRSQHVIEVPSDPHLHTGGIIDLNLLQPATRDAYLELAAVIADGFEEELFTFTGHH